MSLYIIGDLHLSESTNKPMDIFGKAWSDHPTKLIENWKAIVDNSDTVILAGDVSWGMSLSEAHDDFKLIDSLPGKKVILKGNHDYWWDTVTKMSKFLMQNGIDTIEFLYNNSYVSENIAVCGTRGWTPETKNCTENDKKIISREAGRLERSLMSAPDGHERIAVLHYPPIYEDYTAMQFIEIMQKYNVKRCYYGHLHGPSVKNAVIGEHFGINFCLVSADSIDFLPLYI